MERKDNSSQQNYFFLILKAFSRLASGKCITFRRVHRLPSESRQINKGREINKKGTSTNIIFRSHLTIYTECKYGGPLGRPGSSCAKARLERPQEFCFDCASQRLSRSIWFTSSCCTPEGHQKEDLTLAGIAINFPRSFHKES